MGCLKISLVIISAILAVPIAYILYQPLPDEIEQKWDVRKMYFTIMGTFVWAEVKFRLGLGGTDRWSHIRQTIKGAMYEPADFEGLEVTYTEYAGVPVKVYKPRGLKAPVPCLIYLHGGSWTMLDADVYDHPMSIIARDNKIIVVSVNYRLAPEFPYPYPLNDCVTVAKEILNNGNKYGIDGKRVAVGGDSAGGNIAAALVLKLRDEHQKPPIKAHINIYGVLQVCDFTLPIFQIRHSYDRNFIPQALYLTGLYMNLTDSQLAVFSNGNFSTPELKTLCQKYVDIRLLPKKLMFEGYQRSDHVAQVVTEDVKTISEIASNPMISPLLAEDMRGLPATLVISVGWDILGDENHIYAGRLREAGVKVTSVHMEETIHGCFNLFPKGFKAGYRAVHTVKTFLKETL